MGPSIYVDRPTHLVEGGGGGQFPLGGGSDKKKIAHLLT